MNKSVVGTYPDLYHYTTAAGLQGILESQQLHATNIAYLNDAEEHTGYFDRRLSHLLLDTIKACHIELACTKSGKRAIAKSGGIEKVTKILSEQLLTSIRTSTLKYNEPYIASFCAPPRQDPNDGLLSQWRGYGPDGGYAIVFETKGIERLIERECKTFYYQVFFWGNVEYYDQDTKEKAAFPETQKFEETIQNAVRKFVLNQEVSAVEPMYEPITYLSCTHKHRGFREEAEVRIVALPSAMDIYKMVHENEDKRPKQVHFRPKDGILMPYIKLFGRELDDEAGKLPIKKIIIGPHPDRVKRQKAVERLLRQYGLEADVTVSDIPYLGR